MRSRRTSASFARAVRSLDLRRQAALSEKPQTADQSFPDVLAMRNEVGEKIKRQVVVWYPAAQATSKPLPQGFRRKNLPEIMTPSQDGLSVDIVEVLQLGHAPLGRSALQQRDHKHNNAGPVDTSSHKADRRSNASATAVRSSATKAETNQDFIRKITRAATRFARIMPTVQRTTAKGTALCLMRLGQLLIYAVKNKKNLAE